MVQIEKTAEDINSWISQRNEMFCVIDVVEGETRNVIWLNNCGQTLHLRFINGLLVRINNLST